MSRLALSTLLASLAVFAAACDPTAFDGTGATPEICVDAWNRGTKDGFPLPEGRLDPSSAGIEHGFIARRAAVVVPDERSCVVVFDLGGEVYDFRSGSTGDDPRPGPHLAGWLPGQDVQPPAYLDTIGFASWNACQNEDGTLALLAEDSCTPLGPDVRPAAIKERLERRAARSFLAAGRSLPRDKAAFWLGPRFRGSVARVWSPVPAGADVQADYLLRQPGRRELLIVKVLTYAGRVERLPECLDSVCGEPFDPLVLLEREGQTVVVVEATGDPVPAALVEEIRGSLTSQLGYSEAELEAADPVPGPIIVSATVGDAAASFDGPMYWLGPAFQGGHLLGGRSFQPGTVYVSYSLADTVLFVVTATPEGRRRCLASGICPFAPPDAPAPTEHVVDLEVPGPYTAFVTTSFGPEAARRLVPDIRRNLRPYE